MIKNLGTITLSAIFLMGMNACSNNNKFKKTESGLEYKIIKDEKGGISPKEGDLIALHLFVHLGDSVLMDSRKMNNNEPFEIPLMPPSYKGDWVEGLKLLTAGDSAEFLVPVDTLRKLSQGSLPEWMKSGDKISYNVKMVSVKSQADAKKEMEQKSVAQNQIDDKLMQEYFAKNNISPMKTASGIYYVIAKEGAGATPTQGQKVTVNYTGKTLDGVTFDSNVDPNFQHVQPFTFTIGKGEVIPGWDEGIALLKKGGKATLFIPSSLAYGPAAQGNIAANSVLMFDVEMTNIQ